MEVNLIKAILLNHLTNVHKRTHLPELTSVFGKKEVIYALVRIDGNMSKDKHRKCKPSMPYWWWLGQDGCWNCPDQNACSSCKAAKKSAKSSKATKEKGRRHKM